MYIPIKVSYNENIFISKLQVCVKAGIFHGDEALCELLQTSQVSCNTLRWNETLRFQISVPDIPRSARLCVSVCSISRNKRRQVRVKVYFTKFL